MPPENPNEFVHIKHSEVKAFGGPVTRQAFEDVYRHKGWQVATPEEVAKAEESTRVASLAADTTASAGKEKK